MITNFMGCLMVLLRRRLGADQNDKNFNALTCFGPFSKINPASALFWLVYKFFEDFAQTVVTLKFFWKTKKKTVDETIFNKLIETQNTTVDSKSQHDKMWQSALMTDSAAMEQVFQSITNEISDLGQQNKNQDPNDVRNTVD